MSLATHIETLEQKKELLEARIARESARPAPDFMNINKLKKQKLALKEAILRSGYQHSEGAIAS